MTKAMIGADDWKPIGEDGPNEGEPVLIYNGVRVIATTFKSGLTSPLASFPATHYAPLVLPYKPKTADLTGIEPEEGKQRLAKGLIKTCTAPGCTAKHHAHGFCTYHDKKRCKPR